MTLEEFLALQDDAVISAAEAQSLNDFLARLTIQDIPMGDRGRVADYLVISLNMNSVRQEIIFELDSLLHELQTRT